MTYLNTNQVEEIKNFVATYRGFDQSDDFENEQAYLMAHILEVGYLKYEGELRKNRRSKSSTSKRITIQSFSNFLMEQCEFDKHDAEAAARVFRENGLFNQKNIKRMALAAHKNAMKRYQESPAAHKDLHRRMRKQADNGALVVPFIEFLTKEYGVAVKAETMAIYCMYEQLGWLEHDMAVNPKNASPALLEWQELVTSIRNGKMPKNSLYATIEEIFENRLNEIVLCLEVKSSVNANHESIFELDNPGDKKGWVKLNSYAGTGLIDVVMRDPHNPAMLHGAAISALPAARPNSDQVLRHNRSLSNMVENQKLLDTNQKPFTSKSFAVTTGATVYTDVDAPGAISRDLAHHIPSKQDRQAVNFLSFMTHGDGCTRDCTGFDIYDLLEAKHCIIGAESAWEPKEGTSQKQLEKDCAKLLVRAVDIIAKLPKEAMAQNANKEVVRLLTTSLKVVANNFSEDSLIVTSLFEHKLMDKLTHIGALIGNREQTELKNLCKIFTNMDSGSAHISVKEAGKFIEPIQVGEQPTKRKANRPKVK